ncbi:hypothetical protein CFC35_04525 [Streptomyces sp. FBKL.4005]|uniref:Uncharacterized protein n=1 Tax=Streptomyces bangladeshensis TaxID=295352 RepID=A0ABN3BEE9_9ACTN|nr:hypothetical protein CFC35_04525 [Streptomyces sp. FBKL.4005]
MRETTQHTDDVRPRADLSGTDIALVRGTRFLLVIARSALDRPETGSLPAVRPRPLGSVELASEAGPRR